VGGGRKAAKWAQMRFVNLELRNSDPSYVKKKFFIRKYDKMGEKINTCNRAITNFSLRVKRPKREADYSPQSNSKFKNE
jgi:hypothetical protein